ncbi:hypothetical protein TNCV_219761 [Trichonephila clavipes]|nr:hypothetical protein TNCV_219761 [Trichonephila clavipes]
MEWRSLTRLHRGHYLKVMTVILNSFSRIETWHYTRSPADKNTLNKLQKHIKKLITKFEQKQWDESLACLEAEDGTLWSAARKFRKQAPPIPALKGPAKIAYSDADKSEIISESLTFLPLHPLYLVKSSITSIKLIS